MVYGALTNKQLLVKHESRRKREAVLSMRPMLYYMLTVGVNPNRAVL